MDKSIQKFVHSFEDDALRKKLAQISRTNQEVLDENVILGSANEPEATNASDKIGLKRYRSKFLETSPIYKSG